MLCIHSSYEQDFFPHLFNTFTITHVSNNRDSCSTFNIVQSSLPTCPYDYLPSRGCHSDLSRDYTLPITRSSWRKKKHRLPFPNTYCRNIKLLPSHNIILRIIESNIGMRQHLQNPQSKPPLNRRNLPPFRYLLRMFIPAKSSTVGRTPITVVEVEVTAPVLPVIP